MNLHFLAETLHMTVARLNRELSVREYLDWLAYFNQKSQPVEPEPFVADSMEDMQRILG